jgi:hypothetical protein
MSPKLVFDFNKCILCKDAPADSWEHVIPESIGGRLELQCLCRACNNEMGAELVSKIKTDPMLRLALDALRADIPKVVDRALSGTRIVATNSDGETIEIKLRDGKGAVTTRRTTDGFVVDQANAKKVLGGLLRAAGASSEDVDDAFQWLQVGGDGGAIDIGYGLAVATKALKEHQPDLSGDFVDERLIANMAFCFAATAFGNEILHESFDGIRAWIRGRGLKPSSVEVSRAPGASYVPWHVLMMRVQDGVISVQLQIFGIIYQMDISGFSYDGPCPAYLEDVKDGKNDIEILNAAEG